MKTTPTAMMTNDERRVRSMASNAISRPRIGPPWVGGTSPGIPHGKKFKNHRRSMLGHRGIQTLASFQTKAKWLVSDSSEEM